MATDTEWGAIYRELGARPIINAIGSLTLVVGSTPAPEVREAMAAADGAYMTLMELEDRAGAAIATLTGVPAAYVTSGAGSALTLATAAAMAVDDDAKIEQLPDTTGMRNEILIQRRHRYWYDRCLELAGAKLTDYGSDGGTAADDLEAAVGPSMAAVHYLMKEEAIDPLALSLEQTIEIANGAGLPVIVDAAGQVYPLGSLGKYVRMGAAVQCVASKYMSAPQSAGLALGTEEFIYKLSLQPFASYEGWRIRGVGRPQKIDRQEIVGVVAPVKRWVTMDHEERLADAERRCSVMIDILGGILGVSATLITNTTGHHPFGVRLTVEPEIVGFDLEGVGTRLEDGDPPVWTRVREGDDFINLQTFGLRQGEERIVADRIADPFV